MAATITTLDAVLKVYYDTKVKPSLNNKFNVIKRFRKMTGTWSGKNVTVPVHVSRNSGRGSTVAGDAMPTAGEQGYIDLILTAKENVVTVQITREAMAAAKRGDKHSFGSYVALEFNKARDDFASMANQNALYGGLTKGWINEHKLTGGTAGNCTVAVPNAIVTVWQWSGVKLSLSAADGNPFAACVQATSSTWVRVRLRRMDTYAEISPSAGTSAQSAIFVSAINSATSEITLSVVTNNQGAGVTLSTTVVANGVGIAVEVYENTAQFVDSAAANFGRCDEGASGSRTTFLTGSATVLQPTGIATNLSSLTHFGENRTTAAGIRLQSFIRTAQKIGAHERIPLTKAILQEMLDVVADDQGTEPNVVLLSARDRQLLHALIYDQQRNTGSKKGEAGYTSFEFGPLTEWIADQHMGRSTLIMLDMKSAEDGESCWDLWELDPLELVADGKGNTLFPSMAVTADQSALEWRYDHLCTIPRRQIVLIGYSL